MKKTKINLDTVAGGQGEVRVSTGHEESIIHAEPARDFSKWDMFLFEDKNKGK